MITLERAARQYPVGSELTYRRIHRATVLGHERDEAGFACVRVLDGETVRLWPAEILAGCGVTIAAPRMAID